MNIVVDDRISNDFKNFAWNIFFKSKGRGLTFEQHFPWIQSGTSFWTVEARENERLIGGLIVRELEICYGSRVELIGCIGLVCVDSLYRGKGIANQLFKTLIETASIKKYGALTLWTNQHHIYESKGFFVSDESLSGTVTAPESVCHSLGTAFICENLPNHIGLPPFAISGRIYKSKEANITVIRDHNSYIVSDWSGSDNNVCSLIKDVLPESFRIHTQYKCSLVKFLSTLGYSINLSPVNLQMWLKLKSDLEITLITKSSNFNILNRI
ncbi:GNAT family N-acetyltransferase [Shewanella frigidimarina]|uniref:GNAT family N-acetyltransferase n=1 Tax=Shewanella frigidimarina TaxID=56812 RepID=UPI0014046D24|nr:GNAT family N-acetyltransferase [Shewanella frigidimarina]